MRHLVHLNFGTVTPNMNVTVIVTVIDRRNNRRFETSFLNKIISDLSRPHFFLEYAADVVAAEAKMRIVVPDTFSRQKLSGMEGEKIVVKCCATPRKIKEIQKNAQ